MDYICVVPWCTAPALDTHHIWRRTALGRAFNYVLDKETGDVLVNTCAMCRSHHNDVTDNRAQIIYAAASKAYFWKSLQPIPDTPDWGPLKVEALASSLSDLHGPLEPSPSTSTVEIAERTDGAQPGEEARPNAHAGLPPGTICVTCKRKVPHPRKADSPTSRTKAFRVPLDEVEAFNGLLDAAEEIVGVREQPFATFKVLLAALALVVQSPGDVRELLERKAA
jgi:hypothetical protein